MIKPSETKFDFSSSRIGYEQTGYFGKIVIDYLSGNEQLDPFYNRHQHIDSFASQIKEKSINYHHRAALHRALTAQYRMAGLKSESLQLLSQSNSFTITTGHQVCLFTGPLYFIYKIVTAIKTCQLLSEAHPDFQFVPVFWMATEDHDLAEANHILLPEGKIEWTTTQKGAVGRMRTEGLEEVAELFTTHLGIGYRSGELLDMFRTAYLGHDTVADATRWLVHTLFGKYGLLIIDGDDADLKSIASTVFERELFERVSNRAMAQTNARLSEHYTLQASSREINLFYLEHERRERIDPTEDGEFTLSVSGEKFGEASMRKLLSEHPECISPNVVMRPVYQELILPNLAYIGGGGELAYWFQLKEVFAQFDITFPVLMLRNSVMMVSDADRNRLAQLEFKAADLFHASADLESKLLQKYAGHVLDLDGEKEVLASAFKSAREKMLSIDPNLSRSAESARIRAEKVLDSLANKMVRAERRALDIHFNRLEKLLNALFPHKGLQERNINFIPFYELYGAAWFDMLIAELDPFGLKFTIIESSERKA